MMLRSFHCMVKPQRIQKIDKHPRTPIIFIEDPVFAHALFDKKIAIEINKKNKAVNSVFKSLKTNKEVLK